MGLDMYLFRCKKPEGIENGDLLSEEKYEKMQAGRTSFLKKKIIQDFVIPYEKMQ